MWSELIFDIPPDVEKRLFGENGKTRYGFRKTLAALNTKHNIGLPSWAFGYLEDGGHTANSDRTLAMGTTERGLRLAALGSTACQMLAERSGSIHAALMIEGGAIFRMFPRSGEHEASFLPFARHYAIPMLVLGKSTKDNFWIKALRAVEAGSSWKAEADRKLPNAIGRSLMRQAVGLINDGDDIEGNMGAFLAASIAGEKHWHETGTEFGQRLDIKIDSVGGHTLVKDADIAYRVGLRNVQFTMRASLDGLWYLGRQKIEGRGLMVPATGMWSRQQQDAA